MSGFRRRALSDHGERPGHRDQKAVRAKPGRPRDGAANGALGVVLVWLPVVLWAAVIFTLSSIPSLNSGLGSWDTALRKVAHMAEYAVFGALLLRAVTREIPAFAAGVAYAITDEIHQHFVTGRNASPVDVAIDAVGVLVGVAALVLARR